MKECVHAEVNEVQGYRLGYHVIEVTQLYDMTSTEAIAGKYYLGNG